MHGVPTAISVPISPASIVRPTTSRLLASCRQYAPQVPDMAGESASDKPPPAGYFDPSTPPQLRQVLARQHHPRLRRAHRSRTSSTAAPDDRARSPLHQAYTLPFTQKAWAVVLTKKTSGTLPYACARPHPVKEIHRQAMQNHIANHRAASDQCHGDRGRVLKQRAQTRRATHPPTRRANGRLLGLELNPQAAKQRPSLRQQHVWASWRRRWQPAG